MPEPPSRSDELPSIPTQAVPRNIVCIDLGRSPRGVIDKVLPGSCAHPTYRIDDVGQKVFCPACGKELSAFWTLRRLTLEDAEREQRIAYELRLVQQRRERDRAIRRNQAAKRFKAQHGAEASKLQAAFAASVSQERAHEYFSGVKAKLGSQDKS